MRDRVDAWILARAAQVFERRGWLVHHTPIDCHAHLRYRAAVLRQHGRITILTPLPRKVRFRLWRERQLTTAGSWLCKWRRTTPLAVLLWRAFGMWSP